jgi:hypothetical protein
MEQNNFSTEGQTPSPTGGTGFGSTGTTGTGSTAGTAQEKLADVGSTVRDKAGNMKDSLANALDSGADRLRHRAGPNAPLAAATDGGSMAVEASSRLAPVATKVAGGMEATAGWLRETDLDSLKTGVERQVKEHPGRTLLIAVGLGYVIGKSLRK